MRLAGKAGEWDAMLRVFKAMQSAGVRPDVYTFTSLIRACQSCGNRWQKAIAFFKQMQHSGKHHFACICHSWCVQQLFVGIAADSHRFSLSYMLMGYSRLPDHLLSRCRMWPGLCCCRVLGLPACMTGISMRLRAGVKPNVQAYTALVGVCSHAGQHEAAMDTLQAMDAAGIQPDARAFNGVLATCAAGCPA